MLRGFFILSQMHFARNLETSQGRLNFYFNKIFTATGERFHISVMVKNKSIGILMDRDEEGNWQMINKETCPEWILQLEKKLQTVIAIYLSGIE
jgi:hypothetical protein